jgi:cytochrome oxidase complex assembly protein 1
VFGWVLVQLQSTAMTDSPVPQRTPWYSQPWFAAVILAVIIGGVVLFVLHQIRPVINIPKAVIRDSLMLDSEPYRHAVNLATQDSRVIEALGSPIKVGEVKHGIIRTEGEFGWATISIPLSGPHGRATANVVAQRSGGPWEYKRLDVVFEGKSKELDFLHDQER